MRKDITIDGITIKNITQRTVACLGQKGGGKTTLLRKVMRISDLPTWCVDCVGAVQSPRSVNLKIKKPAQIDAVRKVITVHNPQKLCMNVGTLEQSEKAAFADKFFAFIEYRANMLILIDEVHELCPQFRGTYSSKTEQYVRHCRNYNVGVFFTSQRPQAVNKNLLALADDYLIFRILYERDWDVIENLLKPHMTREELMDTKARVTSFKFGDVLHVDVQP